jgi:antitoxin FitA
MSKMIQIRNVPDSLHKTLKLRAVEAGKTLSDYIKDELSRIASRPTLEQIAAKLKLLDPIELKESVVDMLQDARAGR